MTMNINTNINSLMAQANLSKSQSSLATSMQRLSSGLRINSAKDDAAGLAISQRMDAQVRGMNVAIRNANDAISLTQTAEGALSSVGDSLQRMRELAVQSANGTNSTSDQASLQKEFAQLQSEITRVLGGTTFNGQAILAGAAVSGMSFQIGANTTGNDTIKLTVSDMTTDANMTAVTASTATINTTSLGAIDAVINNLDTALNTVNDLRATMGADQNRFSAVIANLQTSVVNQSAAMSRITDADYAAETANMSRSQILQQAGTAMVAQANQQPQQVLRLLQ